LGESLVWGTGTPIAKEKTAGLGGKKDRNAHAVVVGPGKKGKKKSHKKSVLPAARGKKSETLRIVIGTSGNPVHYSEVVKNRGQYVFLWGGVSW